MKAAYIKLIAVCLVIGTLVPSVFGGDLLIRTRYSGGGGGYPNNGRAILNNMTESMHTVTSDLDSEGYIFVEEFPGDSTSITNPGSLIKYKVNYNGNSIDLNIPNAKITKYNVLGQNVPLDYSSNRDGSKIMENGRIGTHFYNIVDESGKVMSMRTVFDGNNFAVTTGKDFGKFVSSETKGSGNTNETKGRGNIHTWRCIIEPYDDGNFEPDTTYLDINMDATDLSYFDVYVDRLKQQKSFSGFVHTDDDVDVRLMDSEGNFVGDLKTGVDGSWNFKNIPVGEYFVQFNKDGKRNLQYRVNVPTRTQYSDKEAFNDMFGQIDGLDKYHHISLFVQPADYYGIDSTGVAFNDANLDSYPNKGMDRFLEGIVGTDPNVNGFIMSEIMMGRKMKVYGATQNQLNYMADWAKVMMGNKSFDDFFEVVDSARTPPSGFDYVVGDDKVGINWGTDGNNTTVHQSLIYNNEGVNDGRFITGGNINSAGRVDTWHEIGNLYTTSGVVTEEGLMNAMAKYPTPRCILQLQYYVDFIKTKWAQLTHTGDFGELRTEVPTFEAQNTSNTYVHSVK